MFFWILSNMSVAKATSKKKDVDSLMDQSQTHYIDMIINW